MKIYYNPACSKCRETMSLIKDEGVEPDVVEYLKTPPSAAELKEVLKLLQLRPRDIIRTKEAIFASLNLNLEDDEAVLSALVQHPELLERPIVVQGSQAVVARPPEKVQKLFS